MKSYNDAISYRPTLAGKFTLSRRGGGTGQGEFRSIIHKRMDIAFLPTKWEKRELLNLPAVINKMGVLGLGSTTRSCS